MSQVNDTHCCTLRCCSRRFRAIVSPFWLLKARLVPFLLNPGAALGRHPPWRMNLQCLTHVAAFLLGVSPAVCTRQPPSASALSSLCRPVHSSVRSWLLRLQSSSSHGATACTSSCFALVRPCAQGTCGRCPPGSGVMFDLVRFFTSTCHFHLPNRYLPSSGITSFGRVPGMLQPSADRCLSVRTCPDVAAKAWLVPFLLDPAAAPGQHPHNVKTQCQKIVSI